MKTITHEGQTWTAQPTGSENEADGQKQMGVAFRCAVIGQSVFGHVTVAKDFDSITDEELNRCLGAALAGEAD